MEPENEGRTRDFNTDYFELVRHFGLTPRTINVGQSNENGDIESQNGHLKACLKQHLLLRGSRDFASVEAYRLFLNGVLNRRNGTRSERLAEELSVMKPLRVERLPVYREEDAKVCPGSTVQVSKNTYSVPSRLIGQKIRARVYDDRIEIYHSSKLQLRAPRLLGRGKHEIDYRHVIHSLLRKPGAFASYRYREAMFPTLAFRRAFDRLETSCSERVAVHDYLRILALAADAHEVEVDDVLQHLLEHKILPRWTTVEEFLPGDAIVVPELAPFTPDLRAYDAYLAGAPS